VKTTLDRVRGIAEERRARAGERLLVCEGLFHLYVLEGREVVALQGVDFEVDWGELVALLGPSGSGKSTTLLLLAGLEPPDAGVVRLDGEDLAELGAAGRQALRRDRVALVFQGYGLLSLLTARENVELPFRVARRDPATAATAATRWLGLLGLGDRADQRTDQLSGGERQRVALARALAVEPAILLVDEPTAELDEENRDRAVGLLRDAADRGAAVVVATHDPEVVDLCDRVVRLVDGRPARAAVEDGAAKPAVPGAPDLGG
jgi:putative ABC transport system ATP-binding protein